MMQWKESPSIYGGQNDTATLPIGPEGTLGWVNVGKGSYQTWYVMFGSLKIENIKDYELAKRLGVAIAQTVVNLTAEELDKLSRA